MINQSPAAKSSDVEFCWEQVLRVRPQFRLSHPYAMPQFSTGILAVQALFAALEEVVTSVSDEGVSRAKLAWWQHELLGPNAVGSQHPVVKVLSRFVALAGEAGDAVHRLLDLTGRRIEMDSLSDENALHLYCHDLGYEQMQLEAAVEAGTLQRTEDDSGSCAAAGLLQLLREGSRLAPQRGYWWLPLSLLARNGQSRNEWVEWPDEQSAISLMDSVFARVLDKPAVAPGDPEPGQASLPHAPIVPGHRHWYVQSVLQRRLLERLRGLHPRDHGRELSITRIGDAWSAWLAARRWANGR